MVPLAIASTATQLTQPLDALQTAFCKKHGMLAGVEQKNKTSLVTDEDEQLWFTGSRFYVVRQSEQLIGC